MYFKTINERETINFLRKVLEYYKRIDGNSVDKILTSKDEESLRNNTGWYNHLGTEHRIFLNAPNMLAAKTFVDNGILSIDDFYAFLTLCTGHEFRHFIQGRCIYEGIDTDGYTQKDVLNAELMLFIRFFFDAYYLINKGNVKYELDAEKFSVANGVKYLLSSYPEMDGERAMVNAVDFYAKIQMSGGIISTLPINCHSTDEIIGKIAAKIDKNERVEDLASTLFVHNPIYYGNHGRFGLDEDRVLTDELREKYALERDGSKRDLLVVKRILELLEKPVDSLEEFPTLKKCYLEKRL